MKNLVVVFLFVILASCIGSLSKEQSSDKDPIAVSEIDSINQGDRIARIQDEYWPFEETVKQADPSLLEVANRLREAY